MKNWFKDLQMATKNGKKEEFLDPVLMQSFQEFLGKSELETTLITWLCVNYKKRESKSITQLFEKLSEKTSYDKITEALIGVVASGLVQLTLEDYSESTYSMVFTHRVEVALRTGNAGVFKQKGKQKKNHDRTIMRMYVHAVLFKSKITDIDAWLEISNVYLEYFDTEVSKLTKQAKLDRLTKSVVLFIYAFHAVEGSYTDWRALSQLFSENRIEARRLFNQWKSPDWKPVSLGLLDIKRYSMGPAVLVPSESFQKRVYGLSQDSQTTLEVLPSSLQRIPAACIQKRKLFYNETELEQIELLRNMLMPTSFNKYQRLIIKKGGQTGIITLLSGGPGTGKTELARQISKETGRDLLLFNVAEQRDKYFGESEKRIKQIFDCYAEIIHSNKRTPILFFNEADSVFQNRTSYDSSTGSTENAIQTILLNELERFEGILICTTNRPESFDAAFNRRFQFQISINPPDALVRFQLLKHHFSDIAPQKLEQMAKQCEFTAAELENFEKINCMQALVAKKQFDRAGALSNYLNRISKKSTPNIGFKI